MVKVGEQITGQALKADGTCYRWWQTTVEEVTEEWVVTFSPPGQRVHDINHPEGGWKRTNYLRAFYWFDRFYSLIEVYSPAGELLHIYININSTPIFSPGVMATIDYELDVMYRPPEPPLLVDEDEFAEAVVKYGYSETLQEKCYAAAREGLELATTWQTRGL